MFDWMRALVRPQPFTIEEIVGVSGITVVELLARVNEQEKWITNLTARVQELEVMVKDLYDARTSPTRATDVQDFLSERVEDAVKAEPTFARTIYNAMAAEIGIDQRTLVTYVTRIAATVDADGARFGDKPTQSVVLARYLAERVQMPNEFGAKHTRRLHGALAHVGVKPKASAGR